MLKRRWYEWVLTIVYFAMLGLCVYLNLTPNHKESLATIIVNAIMFIIVALIFICSNAGCFIPMNTIIRDLKSATDRIRNDAMNTHNYLWKPYKTNEVPMFYTDELQGLYKDFLFELNNDKNADTSYYRSNIDDFINLDLVDKVMHRNELNQVPGMLTGLGILGTFIGLSLGLQSFNTGTTAEMTQSIEPLMNGIKVAFHTSIYGMVFSLTFNAIYKKKLYEAEAAVEEFVTSFKKYVLPDNEKDGMNMLISLTEKQLNAMQEMQDTVADELDRIIGPQFDRLNRTIVDFENMATKNQADALGRIVELFIYEMNQSIGNSFAKLNETVDLQYQSQQQNAELMKKVLAETGSNAANLNGINNETEKLISTLSAYSERINAIQKEMQNTIKAIKEQKDDMGAAISKEQDLIADNAEIVENIRASVETLAKYSKDTNEHMDDTMEELTNGIDYICRALDKIQQTKPAKGR